MRVVQPDHPAISQAWTKYKQKKLDSVAAVAVWVAHAAYYTIYYILTFPNAWSLKSTVFMFLFYFVHLFAFLCVFYFDSIYKFLSIITNMLCMHWSVCTKYNVLYIYTYLCKESAETHKKIESVCRVIEYVYSVHMLHKQYSVLPPTYIYW